MGSVLRHLLNAVSCSRWGSVSPDECSPRQNVQVVVLGRVSWTLEHVQHPLSDQEATLNKKTCFILPHGQYISALNASFFSLEVFEDEPAMLMEEIKAAASARPWGRLEGVRPPPISARPPTAVRPEGRLKGFREQSHKRCVSPIWRSKTMKL